MKITLGQADLVDVRSFALGEVLAMSGRCRLPGMKRDLTMDEKVALAYVRASCVLLVRSGAIKNELLEESKFGALEVVTK